MGADCDAWRDPAFCITGVAAGSDGKNGKIAECRSKSSETEKEEGGERERERERAGGDREGESRRE